MIIKDIGIYISNGKVFEDAAAGVRFKYSTYTAFWFQTENNRVLIAAKIDNNNFEKGDFSDSKPGKPYVIEDSKVKITYNKDTRFEIVKILEILSDIQLMDAGSLKFQLQLWPINE
ncbi:MAG: hypothetical protein IPP15_17095 [Saprospiraceae bacterium]|uniref:Uncharacterized protein n=1 Tax=Candidatus Opimibacter skivensis TaxID=2982028 RepID=A0A9D7XUU6_9BACT|nr:hypothetical protein [Candidatus Opimibacter skivensis]